MLRPGKQAREWNWEQARETMWKSIGALNRSSGDPVSFSSRFERDCQPKDRSGKPLFKPSPRFVSRAASQSPLRSRPIRQKRQTWAQWRSCPESLEQRGGCVLTLSIIASYWKPVMPTLRSTPTPPPGCCALLELGRGFRACSEKNHRKFIRCCFVCKHSCRCHDAKRPAYRGRKRWGDPLSQVAVKRHLLRS